MNIDPAIALLVLGMLAAIAHFIKAGAIRAEQSKEKQKRYKVSEEATAD